MEHACGETLRELVGREPDARGRLGLALRVFPALCEAVAELHGALGHPVVHRDVTPSNVSLRFAMRTTWARSRCFSSSSRWRYSESVRSPKSWLSR